jgi:hypothetical protein
MGAHITYKNGGQRFLGDFYRISSASEVRTENPTRMYIEAKINQVHGRFFHNRNYSQRVWFIGRDIEGCKGAELMPTVDLVGELHFWYYSGPWSRSPLLRYYDSEVQVLPKGSW